DSPEHPPEKAPPGTPKDATGTEAKDHLRPERMSQIEGGGDVVFEDGIHNAKDQ
uniref:GAGE domain-containing protein n=1 Tax=Globodera pallida TaxID=36090 RepID=A0A183CS67_GLOPA